MSAFYRWLWYLLPANPLLVRVVQGGSRRPRHHWVRMGYLGALILLVLIGIFSHGGFLTQSLTDLAKAGAWTFRVISYGQVVFICLLAPLFMAGAIAAEQSGQTFNILLTTPLSNLQIVLGTLVGRLFFILALLASGLPLFSVLLIFGGVPVGSVFVSFAVAALSAVMVGSVAVTLSVLRAGGRKAVFIFVISISSYLVASYALDQWLLREHYPIIPAGTTWLTPLHPLLVLEASFSSTEYRVPPPEALTDYPAWLRFYLGRPLATFTLLTMSLSALLVAWSSIQLRRLGQNEGGGAWASLLRRLRLSRGTGERRHAPREVWHNPIAWREASTRGNRTLAIVTRWSFAALGVAVGAALLAMYHFDALPAIINRSTGLPDRAYTFRLALQTLLMVELAVIVLVALYMSAGSVSREREDGTLDLLLTTPITPRYYIWGKLRGLVSFLTLLLAVPVLTLALVSAYTAVGEWLQWPKATATYVPPQGGATVRQPLMLPEAPVVLVMVLLPYIALCVMVGMNFSLKAKGVMGAIVPSMALLAGVMLVTGFCGWSAAQNIAFVGPVINAFSPTTSLVMIVNPWEHVTGFANLPHYGRLNVAAAAIVAAGGYGLIVYTMLIGMVRTFDFTVRKLTGTA